MCTGRGHIAHVDICMCVEVYMHRHGVDRVTHVDIYVCWGVYAQACEQKPGVNNGIDPQMPFISFFELGLSLRQGTHWFNLSWLPAVSVFCALGFTRVHHRDLLFKWVMGIELSSSCLPRRKWLKYLPSHTADALNCSVPTVHILHHLAYFIPVTLIFIVFSISLVFLHNFLRNTLLKLTDFKTPYQLIHKEYITKNM